MKPFKVLKSCLKRGWMVPFAFCLAGAVLVRGEDAANWPHWRGPQDNGSVAQGNYPVRWDATNVLWSVELPGKGCSTPIVWEKRIYLTAPTNGVDAALAFGWDGKELWETTFGKEQSGKHRNGSGSNPSPATDGGGLFVYFKSGTLAALDFDGKVRWQTNLIEGFGAETLGSGNVARVDQEGCGHRAHASRRVVAGRLQQT